MDKRIVLSFLDRQIEVDQSDLLFVDFIIDSTVYHVKFDDIGKNGIEVNVVHHKLDLETRIIPRSSNLIIIK